MKRKVEITRFYENEQSWTDGHGDRYVSCDGKTISYFDSDSKKWTHYEKRLYEMSLNKPYEKAQSFLKGIKRLFKRNPHMMCKMTELSSVRDFAYECEKKGYEMNLFLHDCNTHWEVKFEGWRIGAPEINRHFRFEKGCLTEIKKGEDNV